MGQDLFLGEEEVAAGSKPVGPRGDDDLYGRLTFDADGQDEVLLEDEFPSLVALVCFQGPTLVAEHGEFRTVTNRYPGEYALVADGDDLVLTGDVVFGQDGPGAELRAPRKEFLAALYDCGRRALALLHSRLDSDPAWADELAALDALAAETAAALG
jgi:hypothetical protein